MRRILLLAGLVLTSLGATAPGASAALYGAQGLQSGPGTLDSRLELARSTGAKLVRVTANWAAIEPVRQGERDPGEIAGLDAVIDGAAARGMRTVLLLTGTPCWASSAPASTRRGCTGGGNSFEVTRYRPAAADSPVPVATFLAARYASRLAAFQIWNEPDQANEAYWAGTNKVGSYVAMVRALYGPLKAAAPKVPVLAGSFVGKDGRWLKALYASGMKGSYDGLAVQFYGATLQALRATRAVQLENGDRTPLWLTEFGWTDCYRKGAPLTQIDQRCVSPGTAAQGTTDVLTAVRKRPWIAATIQYALYDEAPGGYTFGLASRLGQLKPVHRAVRRVLSGRVRTPKRPGLRLRRRGGQVIASGTLSPAERLNLRVTVGGVLRYRATLLPSPLGRYEIALPPQLGTRGLRVTAYAGWTGTRSARR